MYVRGLGSVSLLAILDYADDVLRARRWAVASPVRVGNVAALVGLVVLFGMAYGAVMGTFGGVAGERLLQVFYSAVKVPILLLVTFALGLPSFFVINTLLGLRDDFTKAVRALAATQAGLTIILASLAPFTAVWYASFTGYAESQMFNAAMFAVASVSAQALLRRFYAPLIARDRRHRVLLLAWLGIYAFIGVQMAWVLRPFVGDPTKPTAFFREGAWGNAYVEIARIALRALN